MLYHDVKAQGGIIQYFAVEVRAKGQKGLAVKHSSLIASQLGGFADSKLKMGQDYLLGKTKNF